MYCIPFKTADRNDLPSSLTSILYFCIAYLRGSSDRIYGDHCHPVLWLFCEDWSTSWINVESRTFNTTLETTSPSHLPISPVRYDCVYFRWNVRGLSTSYYMWSQVHRRIAPTMRQDALTRRNCTRTHALLLLI